MNVTFAVVAVLCLIGVVLFLRKVNKHESNGEDEIIQDDRAW